MREILFRGKRKDNGEWVYGSLHIEYGETTKDGNRNIEYRILGMVGECDYVDPETVGQFTGLLDKNGKKIFEGDIVAAKDEIWGSPFCDGITGKIVYDETAYFIEPKDPMETQWLFNECAVYEVIGTIHDNPELMEVQE